MMVLVNNIEDDRDERRVVVVKSNKTSAPGQCRTGGEDSGRGIVSEVEAWLALLNLGKMGFHLDHIYM